MDNSHGSNAVELDRRLHRGNKPMDDSVRLYPVLSQEELVALCDDVVFALILNGAKASPDGPLILENLNPKHRELYERVQKNGLSKVLDELTSESYEVLPADSTSRSDSDTLPNQEA
jgi:hypothetical protein